MAIQLPPRKVFKGNIFNKFFSTNNEAKFYKYVNNTKTHYGFTYVIGLNHDILNFNPTGSHEGGGLYFTTRDLIKNYKSFGPNLFEIKIPDDAYVYVCGEGEYKADKFILVKQISENELEN